MQEKRDAFAKLLEDTGLFNPGHRGAILNYFLDALNNEIEEPTLICRHVYKKGLEGLNSPWADGESKQRFRVLLQTMKDNREIALGVAEWAVWWHEKSRKEKDAIKKPKEDHYKKEWMANQEPTDKQIAYLESLGCQYLPSNRLEASELIEEYVSKSKKGKR